MSGGRPNLLFVFADQLRAPGVTDVPEPGLPAVERMMAEGVDLTRCIATTPVCGPNRACLLTGTYATTHRVLANDMPLRSGAATLGTLAKRAGYRTGYIGKWHLDGMPRHKFTPPGERRFGFDSWAAYNCSHDYYRTRYYADSPTLIQRQGYEPEIQTDLALEFMREARHEGPFALVLSWGPPHDPYDQVPQRFLAMHPPSEVRMRPNVRTDTDNPLAEGLDPVKATAGYHAAVSALDAQLERLLRYLDDSGSAEDTLVVFTSDHGDMLWSHGYMQKQLPYEESIRVPLLLRSPGRVPAGRRLDLLCGTTDILPTLAGLLGWQLPDETEGTDLSPFVLGEPSASRPESVLIANYVAVDAARRQNTPEWRGVRSDQHTYVEVVPGEPWLLFDVDADPFQRRNLVDEPEAREIRAEHQRMLGEWLRRTHDPFLAGEAMVRHFGLEHEWRRREGRPEPE